MNVPVGEAMAILEATKLARSSTGLLWSVRVIYKILSELLTKRLLRIAVLVAFVKKYGLLTRPLSNFSSGGFLGC